MKRVISLVVITFLCFVIFNHFESKPLKKYHIPNYAYYRLDIRTDTPMTLTGKWIEISHYKTNNGSDEWGQLQCLGTGIECHKYDWLTWWVPSLISEPEKPEGDYKFEYPKTLPIGYDPNTGEYLY